MLVGLIPHVLLTENPQTGKHTEGRKERGWQVTSTGNVGKMAIKRGGDVYVASKCRRRCVRIRTSDPQYEIENYNCIFFLLKNTVEIVVCGHD